MSKVKLFWWRGGSEAPEHQDRPRIQNIGDRLSPFLVQKISGMDTQFSNNNTKLLSTGSILQWAQDGDCVWGSGLMNPLAEEYKIPKNLSIRAVRGPLTRNALLRKGIDCPECYGDPALLLPRYLSLPHPNQNAKKWIGVVPHWSQKKSTQTHLASLGERFLLIDPEWEIERFIYSLLHCEFVFSSSLHGWILADAYDVPALPYLFEQNGGHLTDFKFRDYMLSTQREFSIPLLKSMDQYTSLIKSLPFVDKPRINTLPLLNAFPRDFCNQLLQESCN